jgi:hypothetical protein
MKAKVINTAAKSIELSLLAMAIGGLVIAIINLCIGNYGSTACFEI